MTPKRTPGNQWVRNLRVQFMVIGPLFLLVFFFKSISYLLFPGSLKGAADEEIKKFEKENVPTKAAEKVTRTITNIQGVFLTGTPPKNYKKVNLG